MEINEEILAKLDNLNERMNILEKTIYEEVMKPAQEAFDRFDHDERLADFTSRNGEKLSAFNDKLKAIEGPDFDLTSKAFEDYDSLEEKPEEGEYVEALVAKVSEQLDAIAEAFGAKEVEVVAEQLTEDAPTEVEVKADGEVIAEADVADTKDEAEKIEDKVDESVEPESEDENEEEELKAFQKELEAEMAKEVR